MDNGDNGLVDCAESTCEGQVCHLPESQRDRGTCKETVCLDGLATTECCPPNGCG